MDDISGAPPTGRRELEDLPGRRRRTRCGRGWGWTGDPYIGNYGDNSLLYFAQYQNARPGDPLYDRARTGTNAKGGEDFFHVLRSDVVESTLPAVSWVVAPEAYTEHPNWPANYGAWYVAQVLDALTANPDVWRTTTLFITYDENDGFFDHIVPPYAPETAADGASTVDSALEIYHGVSGLPGATVGQPGPYGLGQRVPMIVVSPWSKGGFVTSEVLDHTSIIRFIEQRFGVREPDISPGAGPSAATLLRRSTSRPPTIGCRHCPAPLRTFLQTGTVTRTLCQFRRWNRRCRSRSAVSVARVRCRTTLTSR